MLKRILNHFEARRYDRMFAFVEKRFESVLEMHLEDVEAKITAVIADAVTDEVDLQQEAEAQIESLVTNWFRDEESNLDAKEYARGKVNDELAYVDFDDIARDEVNDHINYNFDTDEAITETIQDWVNDNEDTMTSTLETHLHLAQRADSERIQELQATVEDLQSKVDALEEFLSMASHFMQTGVDNMLHPELGDA